MAIKIDKKNFQTPLSVCTYMAAYVGRGPTIATALEPTPGKGNLVNAVKRLGGIEVTTPKNDFWKMKHAGKYDFVVMNPPFTPMAQAFEFLEACMPLTDNVICLLPWFILINSDRRFQIIRDYGLVSVTHLPRNTFPSCRIQCVVIEMKRGYTGSIELKYFDKEYWTGINNTLSTKHMEI
jgi:hypothetical protein